MSVALSPEDRAIAEKWIETLETTELKQGKYKLGDPVNGYCCLGILCLVTGEAFSPDATAPYATDQPQACRVYEWYTGQLDEKASEGPIGMNDELGFSFKQIAGVLRAKLPSSDPGLPGAVHAPPESPGNDGGG